jgi:hypothetical protein
VDVGRAQFISSPAIGILLTLNKRLAAAPPGTAGLILCGVGRKLLDRLKISKLGRLLTIKPTRKEALAT